MFSAEVVEELVCRAEIGERLAAQIRSDALRGLSPSEGYLADDF